VDNKLTGRKGKCPKCNNVINITHPEPEIPWDQPDGLQPPSIQSWDQLDDDASFREPVIYGAVAEENKNKQKKQKPIAHYISGGIAIIAIIAGAWWFFGGGFDKQEETKPKVFEETKSKVFNERETVNVGYTSYAVWHSWWSNQLSENEFLNQRPNAMYLFVELSVRNDDKKSRMVPPFTLIDEIGQEYEASSNAWAVQGSIGILDSLNPSVSKQGFVVFDVPQQHKYRIKLSGGYWSLQDAYVQLTPKH
jgi:hypothetical protein